MLDLYKLKKIMTADLEASRDFLEVSDDADETKKHQGTIRYIRGFLPRIEEEIKIEEDRKEMEDASKETDDE